MKKLSNNDGYFNGDKFSKELRAQPRKSGKHLHKHESYHRGAASDEDDGNRHHSHRHEPSKNIIRTQLRRIQRLF